MCKYSDTQNNKHDPEINMYLCCWLYLTLPAGIACDLAHMRFDRRPRTRFRWRVISVEIAKITIKGYIIVMACK